ncbi:MAG: biopolymer transporter ExbD, partial [Polyangiaceae bacterium]
DITLVLLIIFMVTAKMIVSNSLLLDLPQAAKGETIQELFTIEVDASGAMRVDGEPIRKDSEVVSLAKKALAKNKNLRAVIRADKSVSHGQVVRMLDLLKQAGVAKIAIGVTPVAAEAATKTDKAAKTAAPKSP